MMRLGLGADSGHITSVEPGSVALFPRMDNRNDFLLLRNVACAKRSQPPESRSTAVWIVPGYCRQGQFEIDGDTAFFLSAVKGLR